MIYGTLLSGPLILVPLHMELGPLSDVVAGYAFGLAMWFVSAATSYMFRAFRVVADNG
jgi:hypothetical protein